MRLNFGIKRQPVREWMSPPGMEVIDSCRRAIRAALEEWTDALYPRSCVVCRGYADDGSLCAQHQPAPPSARNRCLRCARALPEGMGAGMRCAACRRATPAFRGVITLGEYRSHRLRTASARPAEERGAQVGEREPAPGRHAESMPVEGSEEAPSSDVLRNLILGLKHGNRREFAQPLGELLAQRMLDELGKEAGRRNAMGSRSLAECVLVPVPLHRLRKLERGHDQALDLARWISAASGLRLLPVLRRLRATPPQGAPGSVSRRANVHQAFRATRRAAKQLRGKWVFLVDDVLTSGSTASECTRVLKSNGADGATALVLARVGFETG